MIHFIDQIIATAIILVVGDTKNTAWYQYNASRFETDIGGIEYWNEYWKRAHAYYKKLWMLIDMKKC